MLFRAVEDVLQALAKQPISARAIARKSGVAYSTICKWRQRATYSPRIDTLTAVAKTLGLSICTIDGETRAMPPASPRVMHRIPRTALWRLQ